MHFLMGTLLAYVLGMGSVVAGMLMGLPSVALAGTMLWLGSLVTIGHQGPYNFLHIVLQNGIYEVNGEFPVPGGTEIDFASMALAAGYREAHTFCDLDSWARDLPDILASPGPILVALKVEAGQSYFRDYPAIHSEEARERFRSALAARQSG